MSRSFTNRSTREQYLIERMAKAMARRAGTPVDEMRPSTWAKWKQFAEAALEVLVDEVADLRAAQP